jgi:DNA-directed RNA polymerase specialized sigma24 family protein
MIPVIDHAAAQTRQAVELRQYQQITHAVQAAARTYARRTGSTINTTDTTTADLAADAYIILSEAQQAAGGHQGNQRDQLRRAAYEAVRRAARAQRRNAHAQELGDQDMDMQAPGDMTEALEIREAIRQAGPVAALLAQGLTVSDISRRQGVSISTAWRLAQRAREQVRQALAMC